MSSAEARAWVDGRIFTGTGYAEALLVDGGRVIAVGSEPEVRRAAPTGTEWSRLAGRLVIPGLIDPHLHWLDSVVESRGVDLRGCRATPEIRERLAAAAVQHPTGPLLGGGWDQEVLKPRRYPTRRDLDPAVPDRPVALYRICHHAAVVNSATLATLGIDRTTPDPPGGRIDRDASGDPTGLLFDHALRPLRSLGLGAFEAAGRTPLDLLGQLARRGLTTIGAMSALPDEIEAARAWAAQGPLPVALRFYLRWDERRALARFGRTRHDPAVAVVGLKMALDGSLGARTAWLEAPYSDQPEGRGLALASQREVESAVDLAESAGVQLALHAIGDRALRQALDGLDGRRVESRIEHAAVAPPALQDRLRHSGVAVVVQPRFVSSDTWIPQRLGPERTAWAYPFRSLLDRGLLVAGSSDAPIEPFDPWTGLEAAVQRSGLTPEEAVRLYTASAGAALREPSRGTLAPGAPADLVVVDAPGLAEAIAAGGPVHAVLREGRPVAGEGAI